MEKVAPYWKAVLAFIAPAAAIIISAVLATSDGGTTITQAEWITALATAIITSAGVYTVPNKAPAPPADNGFIG